MNSVLTTCAVQLKNHVRVMSGFDVHLQTIEDELTQEHQLHQCYHQETKKVPA